MKEYALLTNSTYLYLIQNKGIKINFSQISRELGLNRKTIAKEYEELIQYHNWYDCFDIKNFYNEEKNKNYRAYLILRDIRPDITAIEEIANALGISAKTLYNLGLTSEKNESDSFGCIYKIMYKNEIIYIGSTKNFEERKYQHLSSIENKYNDKQLYRYCLDNNIKASDLVIEPVIYDKDLNSRFSVESAIINLIKPVGNSDLFMKNDFKN